MRRNALPSTSSSPSTVTSTVDGSPAVLIVSAKEQCPTDHENSLASFPASAGSRFDSSPPSMAVPFLTDTRLRRDSIRRDRSATRSVSFSECLYLSLNSERHPLAHICHAMPSFLQ